MKSIIPCILLGSMFVLCQAGGQTLVRAQTLGVLTSPLQSPHREGVDSCPACHMGDQSGQNSFGASSLVGSDPSSTCLRCHSQVYRVFSRDGSAYSPGGDFFWLTKSYRASGYDSPADSHGHNIIAAEYGLYGDSRLFQAPSDGSAIYNSDWLSCTSCHDPHAKVAYDADNVQISGNYRLLGGIGYNGGGMATGIRFSNPAPIARAYPPQLDQWPPETDTNHVDYGSGMSEWCANCHSGFDTDFSGSNTHRHPSGNRASLGSLSKFYDFYRSSGDFEGDSASAFDRLVPFERGDTDPKSLNCQDTEGPGPQSNVMCLSCHRAHASPFSAIGRWDFKVVFLPNSPVFASPEAPKAYYGERIEKRYNNHQRSLCNKCHVMD